MLCSHMSYTSDLDLCGSLSVSHAFFVRRLTSAHFLMRRNVAKPIQTAKPLCLCRAVLCMLKRFKNFVKVFVQIKRAAQNGGFAFGKSGQIRIL